MVARILCSLLIPGAVPFMAETASLKGSSHVAICQGGDHPVYPEGSLAEGLHLKTVDREFLKRIGSLCGILGWEFDHLRDEKRLYGGHLLVFGVGESVEQGTLVGYVLIDDPRR